MQTHHGTFKSYSKKGEGRNATQHYPCMSLDDICNMDIDSIADKDCVLLMWVTDPCLLDAFKVIAILGLHLQDGRVHLGENKTKVFRISLQVWVTGHDLIPKCVYLQQEVNQKDLINQLNNWLYQKDENIVENQTRCMVI